MNEGVIRDGREVTYVSRLHMVKVVNGDVKGRCRGSTNGE